MAHSSNIISSIKLPNGNTYEIHDAQAIHDVSELGINGALIFKGTVTAESELPTASASNIGHVYLNATSNIEYVCVQKDSTYSWEKLGNIHDAASSTHKHNVTVTGSNAASTVTGTVTVPTVSKTTKYMKATATAGTVTKPTDSVLGADTTVSVSGGTATTTNIKATASGAAVGANGTAKAITGFGEHSTDTALGTGATFKVTGGTATTNKMVTTTIKNPTVTAVSIPNVTGNTEVTASKVKSAGSRTNGSAASWGATVTDGVLEFSWTANTPTSVTLPTFDTVTATNTTLGDDLSASSVSTSNVTVATGTVSSSGTGSAVATGVSAISVAVDSADTVTAITALGTPTTANALTGVKVTAQPTIALATGATAGTGVISVATGVSAISASLGTNDLVDAVTDVTVAAPSVSLSGESSSATGRVAFDTVSIGSTSASLTNGSAAAQKWTQGSGSTGTPQ